MKLTISKSANSTSYYVCESYRNAKGHCTSRIVRKLGTEAALREKLGPDTDIKEWCRQEVQRMNEEAAAGRPVKASIEVTLDQETDDGERRRLNVGYLIVRRILCSLGLPEICDGIRKKKRFAYDLQQIMENLVCARVIVPHSKKSTFEWCTSHLMEQPEYQLHDVCRALSVIAAETEAIQSGLYKYSLRAVKRHTEVLYYDCTNFYFEISEEDGFRMYGHSKENRPNPIVQMGLFMDASGMPLAFDMTPGNRSEQLTMIPLEKQILKDFELAGAGLTVCADAGLCSAASKNFNSRMNRSFIVIRPIKKMPEKLRRWALHHGRSLNKEPLREDENPDKVRQELELYGWRCAGRDGIYSLDDIDESLPGVSDLIFYKERYAVLDEESGKTERLIITYSVKYRRFMEHKRSKDIERAEKLIKQRRLKKSDLKKNDVTRCIQVQNTTASGEEATETSYELDAEEIGRQAQYDGFYGVSTGFDMYDPETGNGKRAEEIAEINRGRWEIEESFALLKSEFRARPVFLSREDRIRAHFTVCFMALMAFRTLEARINAGRGKEERFTARNITKTLRDMTVTPVGEYYTGNFDSSDTVRALQELTDMKFNCEALSPARMRQNIRNSKKILPLP